MWVPCFPKFNFSVLGKSIHRCFVVLPYFQWISRFKAKLYQMQVNAHHLDKNNGLLTSHQNTCNFVPKLSYFNVVCSNLVIGFKTFFWICILQHFTRLIEICCIVVSVYNQSIVCDFNRWLWFVVDSISRIKIRVNSQLWFAIFSPDP